MTIRLVRRLLTAALLLYVTTGALSAGAVVQPGIDTLAVVSHPEWQADLDARFDAYEADSSAFGEENLARLKADAQLYLDAKERFGVDFPGVNEPRWKGVPYDSAGSTYVINQNGKRLTFIDLRNRASDEATSSDSPLAMLGGGIVIAFFLWVFWTLMRAGLKEGGGEDEEVPTPTVGLDQQPVPEPDLPREDAPPTGMGEPDEPYSATPVAAASLPGQPAERKRRKISPKMRVAIIVAADLATAFFTMVFVDEVIPGWSNDAAPAAGFIVLAFAVKRWMNGFDAAEEMRPETRRSAATMAAVVTTLALSAFASGISSDVADEVQDIEYRTDDLEGRLDNLGR